MSKAVTDRPIVSKNHIAEAAPGVAHQRISDAAVHFGTIHEYVLGDTRNADFISKVPVELVEAKTGTRNA